MALGSRGGSTDHPGTCGSFRHEEAVQVPGHELGGRRLTNDYVDDVLAVEVAGVSKERLSAVVVVLGQELKLRDEVAAGIERDGLRETSTR